MSFSRKVRIAPYCQKKRNFALEQKIGHRSPTSQFLVFIETRELYMGFYVCISWVRVLECSFCSRRKCVGRCRKQQADFTLLAGLPQLALDHYQTAIELLKSANDILWLAGEGVTFHSTLLY